MVKRSYPTGMHTFAQSSSWFCNRSLSGKCIICVLQDTCLNLWHGLIMLHLETMSWYLYTWQQHSHLLRTNKILINTYFVIWRRLVYKVTTKVVSRCWFVQQNCHIAIYWLFVKLIVSFTSWCLLCHHYNIVTFVKAV